MSSFDWIILVAYLVGMILLSVYLGRGQKSQDDYFVGGRNLPWWAVGLSTMATQSSATSFISIPAFVALKPEGGLKYLQWEFAVPLAMIFIMVFLIPFFRNLNLISVYEYIERRFGSKARTILALVFLVSRGLGTGVGLLAVSIVIAVFLNIHTVYAILLIGIITLIYDTIGGMKAVVYSDVIQMVVLLAGIFICCFYANSMAGGIENLFVGFDPSRTNTIDFSSTGLGDGNTYNFWAMTIGGFFLYASYYGCDQSQTQRELSAPTLADTKLSLIFNGLARYPLIILYVVMGVFLSSALTHSSEYQALMNSYVSNHRYDYLLPVFVLNFIPDGIRAVIFAAILAAAMSSLDSSLNSLSASTMQDFVERFSKVKTDERKFLLLSKFTTVCWGIFAVLVATGLFYLNSKDTIVEVINKVGSIFYGPILATFVMGVSVPFVSGAAVILAVITGVLVNVCLASFVPGVSWLWWNAIGFLVCSVVSIVLSKSVFPVQDQVANNLILWESGVLKGQKKWLKWYLVLFVYFLVMLAVSAFVPTLFH